MSGRNLVTAIVALALLVIVADALVHKHVERLRAERKLALVHELSSIRVAIRGFRASHGHYPSTLGELVASGALRNMPVDPISGSATSWKPTYEVSVHVNDFQHDTTPTTRSVVDVHSGAAGRDPEGRLWSEY